MTYVSNPSAAAILDVERFPTANLPVAVTPLSGQELMVLVQNGSNCYIQASAFAGMFNFAAGVSTLGNTSGQTGLTQSRLVLAGAGQVTLSQQNDSAGATVWIEAATSSQSVQAVSYYLTGNTTLNTAMTAPSALYLSGGSNVTLGLTNGSLLIQGPSTFNQSVQAGSFTAAGNTVFGSTMTVPGGLIVQGSNNITVGLTNGSLLISGPNTFAQSVQAGSFTLTGNTTLGSSMTDPGGLIISAANNITAGLSNGSLVLQGASAAARTVTASLIGNIAPGNASTFTFADTFYIAGYGGNLSIGGSSNTLALFAGQSVPNISYYVTGNTSFETRLTTGQHLTINASDNITAGLTNGSLVLIGGGASLTQSVQAGSYTAEGNTIAGSTLTVPGGLRVYASNNITAGLTNGSLVLIGPSAPAQSTQQLSFSVAGNTTLGTSLTAPSALVINASNNITAGLSNGSLVLVAPSPGGASFNISAGTASQNLTNLVFSNSNGVSFGLSGSTITASRDAYTQSVQAGSYTVEGNTVAGSTLTVPGGLRVYASNNITAGLTNGSLVLIGNSSGAGSLTVSAGTSSAALQSLVFSNNGGVSWGLNGSTITASAGGGGSVATQNYWVGAPGPALGSSNVVNSAATMFLQPMVLANQGVANYAEQAISIAVNGATNTSNSGAVGLSMGLYTLSGSTLSLVSSGARSFTWTLNGTNGLNQLTGLWNVTVPLTVNATPGNYWVAMVHTSTRQINSATVGLYMLQAPPIKGKWPTSGPSISEGVNLPGWGHYRNTTNALPSTLRIDNNEIWENNLQFMSPFMYTTFS